MNLVLVLRFLKIFQYLLISCWKQIRVLHTCLHHFLFRSWNWFFSLLPKKREKQTNTQLNGSRAVVLFQFPSGVFEPSQPVSLLVLTPIEMTDSQPTLFQVVDDGTRTMKTTFQNIIGWFQIPKNC